MKDEILITSNSQCICGYEIQFNRSTIRIPKEHKFLTALYKDKQIKVYALVNIDEPLIPIQIISIGTGEGWNLVKDWKLEYIASVTTENNVWHLFIDK